MKLGGKMGICLTSLGMLKAYSNSVLDAKDSSISPPSKDGGLFL